MDEIHPHKVGPDVLGLHQDFTGGTGVVARGNLICNQWIVNIKHLVIMTKAAAGQNDAPSSLKIHLFPLALHFQAKDVPRKAALADDPVDFVLHQDRNPLFLNASRQGKDDTLAPTVRGNS